MTFSIEPLNALNIHSRFTVFKRLIHLGVIAAALIVFVSLLSIYSEYRAQWYRLHSSQPGEILSLQYAKILQPVMQRKEHQAILDILKTVTELPLVISASVYDDKGIELVASGAFFDVTQSPLKSQSPITYIQTITDDSNHVIGYFQLLLDRELTLTQPITLNHQVFAIGIGLALLSAIFSIYITRGIYKSKPKLRKWLTRLTDKTSSED